MPGVWRKIGDKGQMDRGEERRRGSRGKDLGCRVSGRRGSEVCRAHIEERNWLPF